MAAGNQSLDALLRRTSIDDHDEILEACNSILKRSKGNLEAAHVKTVALVKLDRYDDALRVLEQGGDSLKARAQLEHAYVLYKLGRLEDARALSKEIVGTRGAKHVEAQASYRLADFPDAARLYKDLASYQALVQQEENDLRINGSATDAQLEWKRLGHLVEKKKPGREDLEAFETAYNAACGYIGRGEFGQGEVLLRRARDLCISSELSEQVKKDELLPISVQQLYVLSALGRIEQAEVLASEISVEETPDMSTRQIGQINKLTASSKPLNPYLSHRLFHSTPPLPATDSFFEFQANIATQDDLAIDLQLSKYTGVVNCTARYLSDNPSPTLSGAINNISTINAAAHAQNQLGKLGLKAILPLLEKRPNDVGLIMTIIHLYVLTKNHGSAITVLESFFKRLDQSSETTHQDVRYAPGLVSILVSLYSLQGRKSRIKTELAKAASYWRHKSKPSLNLLRAAGISLLDSSTANDLKVAGEIFESLHREDPKDRFALAGYVAAYATIDISKTEGKAEQLTPLSRLTAGLDVDALDQAGIPRTTPIASSLGSRKRARDDPLKAPKKRVRKSRLPKEYDPTKTADPERWIPVRDRSSYRPKGKKGKQKAAALTQGGVGEKGGEGLNMAATDSVVKPSNTVISGPSKPKKKKPKK